MHCIGYQVASGHKALLEVRSWYIRMANTRVFKSLGWTTLSLCKYQVSLFIKLKYCPLIGKYILLFRCRAFHRRAKDFVQDNCCLANTTAFQLRSKLINDNVICASYKNEVCSILLYLIVRFVLYYCTWLFLVTKFLLRYVYWAVIAFKFYRYLVTLSAVCTQTCTLTNGKNSDLRYLTIKPDL